MSKNKTAVSAKEKHNRARRFRRQALGITFTVLAIVGAATIIYSITNTIHKTFFDDSTDKQDFGQLIAPIVAMDPTPFATIEEADQDILLEAAIWASLSYEDTAKYDRNENDLILLPAIDVERYISKMYGPNYSLTHHSFFDLDIEFVYDSSLSAYIIPITSLSGSYTPVVENITNSGNTKILKVAYMQSSSSAVDVVLNASAQTVSKYMEYVMLKDANGYYLYSIRNVEQSE